MSKRRDTESNPYNLPKTRKELDRMWDEHQKKEKGKRPSLKFYGGQRPRPVRHKTRKGGR